MTYESVIYCTINYMQTKARFNKQLACYCTQFQRSWIGNLQRVAKFKLRKQNECQIFYKQQHGACNLHKIPKIKLIFIYFIPAIPIYSIIHGPYMVITKPQTWYVRCYVLLQLEFTLCKGDPSLINVHSIAHCIPVLLLVSVTIYKSKSSE